MKKLLLTITTLFLGLFTMASCEFTKDNSKVANSKVANSKAENSKVANSKAENSIVEDAKVYLQFEAKASDEKVEDKSVLNTLYDLEHDSSRFSDLFKHSYHRLEIEQDGAFYKIERLFTEGTSKEYFEKKSNIGTEYIATESKEDSSEIKDERYSTKGKIYLNNKFVNIDNKNENLVHDYLGGYSHIFNPIEDEFFSIQINPDNVYKQGDTLYSKTEKGYIIFLKNKVIRKLLNKKIISYIVLK